MVQALADQGVEHLFGYPGGAVMPIYDAILFDFDGVLADTEPLHCQCWAEILKPFGYELTWETFVREFVGVSDQDLVRRMAAQRAFASAFDASRLVG